MENIEIKTVDDIELIIEQADIDNILNNIKNMSKDEINSYLSNISTVNNINPNLNKYKPISKENIILYKLKQDNN